MQKSFHRFWNIISAFSLWNIVFGMTMLVYAAGLFVTNMEPDAAVYAQVSMEMHDRGDYLSIYHKGKDWLDKPHFPFWMSAFSYKIFGVNTFAYKLPAVLFTLLAAGYTFLFGRRYYSELHGWIAALLLVTAQHIIISNQDVRAEPFMTGLVIMALFHLAVFADRFGMELKGLPLWGHAVAGSLALACLMMTKGLFTVIPVGAGLGLALLYQRNWKAILSWRWMPVVALTAVFLFPALYGYYRQFDLHPEKIIFGRRNVSGVEFFLWTSQWGRFTNTGPITGKGDLSFFVHTMLWAFLPWAFAAFYALYHKTRQLVKRVSGAEDYTFFGFISLFLIFSVSKFQLSFYLNPLFPLLAIITASALLDAGRKPVRVFAIMHTVICGLLLVALCALHFYFLHTMMSVDTILIGLAGIGMAVYLFTRRGIFLKKIFFATPLVVLSVNYYLNRDFYPVLLTYQAESEVAYYMKDHGINPSRIVFLGDVQSVADLALHHTTPIISFDSLTAKKIAEKYVFTSAEGEKKIDSIGISYQVVREFEDFHVTRLTGKFINRNTRSAVLQRKLLLKTGPADFSKPGVEVTGAY